MKVIQNTTIPDVLFIEPEVHMDERGSLYEAYNHQGYFIAGAQKRFVQANIVRSYQSVLRGMHYQAQYPQGKLVTVLQGNIMDVVMDIRPTSATFGKVVEYNLFPDTQVYIPPGFAHGFLSLSEEFSLVMYHMTSAYYPALQKSILWNSIPFDWKIGYPILSKKDEGAPTWQEISAQLTK